MKKDSLSFSKAPLALTWGGNLGDFAHVGRLARDYSGDVLVWRGLENREKLEKRLRQALLLFAGVQSWYALKYLSGSAVP